MSRAAVFPTGRAYVLTSTRFTRGAAFVAVASILATLVGLPPMAAAAAPVGQKCRDTYTITKPTPSKDKLPGFGSARETADPNGQLRPYQYHNPGVNVQGLRPPTAAELARYGTSTDGKAPGTVPHVYAAWNRYISNKAAELKKWEQNPVGKKPSDALPWDKWLSRYIPNQGNDARGKEYEKILVEEIGLGGDEWICQGDITQDGQVRRYDAVNGKDRIAYEFKSGRNIDAAQLAKDAQIAAKQNYKIVYVFGDKPTAATIRKLQAAGVDYHVMRATPEAIGTPKPNIGPSSQLMNPNPRVPSQGAFNDLIGGSGKNLDQAREVAAVDEDLARRSGRPDQAMRRPGGIDFSTMELKYVSETDASQGLGYSFEANDVPDEDAEPSFGGLEAAQLASDSLFTWLAVPSSSFWVNLNPDTPDKIIDPTLAKTDAGRILLESDLLLKKTHAKLLNPDTPLGDKFWDAVHFDKATEFPCLPLRLWITPGTASVREDGAQLYILDAPLKVNAEFFKVSNLPPGVKCQQTDEVAKENVTVYQRIILPELEKQVNTDPGYADLRRVYLSRVAAEWLRRRAATKTTVFTPIIGSGDVNRWPARTAWSFQDVYKSYLKSFNEGDYTYKRDVEDGGQTITVTFTMGGVDFSQSPRKPVSATTFKKEHPTLPITVSGSKKAPLAYGNADVNLTWLGGDAQQHHAAPPATQPGSPGGGGGLPITGSPVAAVAGVGTTLLVAGLVLLAWLRRRRRTVFRA
jgi:hypothetical protein